MNKTVIIGGGIIGLCCAYYLSRSGHAVMVIDRGDIQNGTSFGNAGYISPSHFTPLASPGIIAKGIRWMLSSSSPFYIQPRADIELVKWGLQFYRSANATTAARNTAPLLKILNLSRELTVDIKTEMGNPFRMEEKGCFMLYKSAGTEKHEIELAKEAGKLGIDAQIYNAKEIQQFEPELEVSVRGGVLYPIDCHLHPGDFMHTLKSWLISNGVEFKLNTEVTGFKKQGTTITDIVTSSGAFPCTELIIAAGSWLPLLTRKLGLAVLLQAGKGYSVTYQNITKNIRYPAILVDNRVAMTPMGADLRMGGTMEISGINNRILIKRVHAIFNAAKSYYPGLPVEFPKAEGIWSGLRPLSPDGLPYIGRTKPYANLIIAGGHAMLGLSLAAGTGKLVEEIINGKKPQIDISAFAVDRFN